MRMPNFEKFGVSAYVYGAPEFMSFGEVRRYLEYAAAVDYDLARHTAIYLGYRQVSYDIGEFEDVRGDDGFHAGLRFKFWR
jgi:hypothetical protein